tara:strand:- start:2846 stop:3070 length:225 start_codon:yes stop_codon:yes gene_type:complete
MSDTSIETRINRLEWSMEQSQLRLKEIDDTQSNLKKSIYSIERSLLQIRYFIMGGISILLIIEMGLMSLITKLF